MPVPITETRLLATICDKMRTQETPEAIAEFAGYGPEQRSHQRHKAIYASVGSRFGREQIRCEERVRERRGGPVVGGAQFDLFCPTLALAVEIEMGTLRRIPSLLLKAAMDGRVQRLIIVCGGEYVVGHNGQGARPFFPRERARGRNEQEGAAMAQRGFIRAMMTFMQTSGHLPGGVMVISIDDLPYRIV